MPVSEVTSADMLEILAPIWHEKAATARKLRQRLRAVLEWAVAMEFRIDNPCDRIGPVLGPQHNVVQHMRALPHREVAAAIRMARASTVPPAVRLAFEFVVLTAAPWGEVRWAEAAYRRTDLFERRRRLMGDWAAYLAGAPREPEVTTPRGNAAELR